MLFTRQPNGDVLVSIKGTTDSVLVAGFMNDAVSRNICLKFNDGTAMTKDEIYQKVIGIYGTAGNDALTGTANQDYIYALAGNDTINGGAGSDYMYGGTGNDTYYVDSVGDTVVENVDEGTDIVHTTASYILSDNVENLILDQAGGTINGTGNELNNSITGNNNANVLNGGGGNDRLDAWDGNDTLIGGRGNDYMEGGSGSDNYVFNIGDGCDTIEQYGGNASTTDQILFGAGITKNDLILEQRGFDAVIRFKNTTDQITLTSFVKQTDARLDKMTFADGSSMSAAEMLKALALQTQSTSGDDVLGSKPGTSCTLSGGAGNDSYYVHNASDQIIEAVNSGTDAVYSMISRTLEANVENLFLDADGGSINGYGNELNNKLTGNANANTLSGQGGNDWIDARAGDDTLIGGRGDDYLEGGQGSDTYIFNRGDGKDTIDQYGGDNSSTDRVVFGSGIAATDMIFTANATDHTLLIKLMGTTDSVQIREWNTADAQCMDRIETSDGKMLYKQQVDTMLAVMTQMQAEKGMSWSDLIANRPMDVQTVVNQFWVDKK